MAGGVVMIKFLDVYAIGFFTLNAPGEARMERHEWTVFFGCNERWRPRTRVHAQFLIISKSICKVHCTIRIVEYVCNTVFAIQFKPEVYRSQLDLSSNDEGKFDLREKVKLDSREKVVFFYHQKIESKPWGEAWKQFGQIKLYHMRGRRAVIA
jgi:hypothetical protein